MLLSTQRLGVIWHAFVRMDGMLCIVDAARQLSLPELRWHTIDPASGQTLSCKHMHFWFRWASSLNQVYHCASHRLVALGSELPLAVMEADSLEAVSCISVLPRHQQLGQVSCSVGLLAWSHDGGMLAVSIGTFPQYMPSYWPCGPTGNSEVHIHDISSGQCVQSIFLHSSRPSLTWSSSQDLLMVYCDHEHSTPEAATPADGTPVDFSPDGQSRPRGATVRILDPAKPTHVRVDDGAGSGNRTDLEGCKWSPCGTFLIRSRCYKHNTSCDWEWGVQDPATFRYIYKAPGRSSDLSWGSKALPGGEGQALTASLAASHAIVTFWRANGIWQAAASCLTSLPWCDEGSLSPSGHMLVAMSSRS